MPSKKILFIDLETTGRNSYIHAIHSIGCILDIDGKTVARYHSRMRPYILSKIEPGALEVSGTHINDLKTFPSPEEVFEQFLSMLSVALDPAGKDKVYISGYGVAYLDVPFLIKWYELMGKRELFKSHFFHAPLDVMTLSAQRYIDMELSPVSYSLENMLRLACIPYVKDRMHDAMYDTEKARELYYHYINQ